MLGLVNNDSGTVIFGIGSGTNMMLDNTTIGKNNETICVSTMKNTTYSSY